MRGWVLLVLTLACRRESTAVQRLAEGCMCPCACDAAVPDATVPDAPVDAGALAIDLDTPWSRQVLTAGSPTLIGADGVARDVDGCLVTPWEQGNRVTRLCGAALEVMPAVSAPEDAEADDIDGDGAIDVVIAANQRVYVVFRGTTNTLVALTASTGHGNAMQVAIADFNADAHLDIVFGTTAGVPAVVAVLEHPGPALVRDPAAWTYRQVSKAGWVMSLVPRDVNGDGRMDVIVSDRAKVGTADWSLYGARWSEQLADGTWLNHTIAGGSPTTPATPYQTGGCSPYASPTCLRTPGDEMMLSVAGNAVYDCTSLGSQVDSRILIHRTTDWLTWTHELVPAVADVGHCQHVVPADVDADGDLDIIVSTWKHGTFPAPEPAASRTGLYWLRAPEWSRGVIAIEGTKFDNLLWDGSGVVTSEQLGPPAGGVGVARYSPGSPP
jgi:hypothetical protein